MTDLIRLIHDFGPTWGPPLALAAVLYFVFRYQWCRDGARGIKLFASRLVAIVLVSGTIFLSSWYYYRYRYWGLPESFRKEEIGVLVAEVPGDTNRQQQAAYSEAIRLLVEKTPDLKKVVKVRFLQRPLSTDPEEQQTEAVRLGRWLHASFVLRTFTVEGVQQPVLTFVDRPEFPVDEAPMSRVTTSQLATLDRTQLPSDVNPCRALCGRVDLLPSELFRTVRRGI